jgi:hypothetical protein
MVRLKLPYLVHMAITMVLVAVFLSPTDNSYQAVVGTPNHVEKGVEITSLREAAAAIGKAITGTRADIFDRRGSNCERCLTPRGNSHFLGHVKIQN